MKNLNQNYSIFLPEGKIRQGEGGLRTQGVFKTSYPNKPLISVITVVYNGEKYLEDTIQSVINQTYDNVEYIIIDGGSTDGTIDIIKKYEEKIDYWVSEKDNGIYDAWNKGVNLSMGDWIGFLGADDFYLSDTLKKYCAHINKSNTLEYISSKNILCTDEKRPLRTIGSKWKWSIFSKFMNVAHVGSLHHKNLFTRYGLYDTNFKICGDYELLLRVGPSLKAEFLDDITCYMRTGGISNSNFNTFTESYKAKTMHAHCRHPLLARIDMYIAIIKWKIRNFLFRAN